VLDRCTQEFGGTISLSLFVIRKQEKNERVIEFAGENKALLTTDCDVPSHSATFPSIH
jgi:hypothetical protein